LPSQVLYMQVQIRSKEILLQNVFLVYLGNNYEDWNILRRNDNTYGRP